jgi:S1-C subfamily serine protease
MTVSTMKRSMSTRRVAALLTVALGVPLGAQTAGTVSGAPSAVRVRVIAPTQAQLDTLHGLMRQLEQLTPGSPAREVLMRQIDGLMPVIAGNNLIVRDRAPMTVGDIAARLPLAMGWIGLNVQGLHTETITSDGYVVEYFDHPSVTSVDPESPAQHAGIAPGDVLLAYNGSDLLGHRFDLTDLLVPEKKLSVTIRRDGDTREYDLVVAKAPGVVTRRRDTGGQAGGNVYFERIIRGEDAPPRVPIMAFPRGAFDGPVIVPGRSILVTPNGALGAIMSTVSPELAKTLRLETGVLVNDVSDGTPASKAGLHPGDVIVSVSGRPVASLRSLQEQILRRPEPTAVLQIIRDKKTRKITVSW